MIGMRVAALIQARSDHLGCRWRRLNQCRRIGLRLFAFLALIAAGLAYWSWIDWPVRVALRQPGEYWPVAFAPDGTTLATTGWQQDITLWNLDKGTKRATWAHPPGCHVSHGAFAPDGRTFVAHWFDRDAKPQPTFGIDLIDVATGRVRARVPAGPGFCSTRAFMSGGIIRHVVFDQGIGVIVEHDVATGREVARRLLSCADSGWFVFSNDGRCIAQRLAAPNATSGARSTVDVLIWDVDRDREVARLRGRPANPMIITLAISGDGETVALGHDDGSIGLWDYPTGRLTRLRGHKPGFSVMDLEFAPDGATLAAVGRFTGSTSPIVNLSTELAVALRNRRFPVMDLILLDVATGRRLRRAEWEGCPVFSPDGRSLATTDGTFIKVRDIPGRR
jgi:WD40 repeat protein